ncbi:hypothetical protein KBC70_02240 [Candidatus Woesebacteria bacterium]|nr:hypothetical protein [Candidatus Woesebacteria bacterium]
MKTDQSDSTRNHVARSFHIGRVKVTPRDIFVNIAILAIVFPLVMWAWNGKPLF